MATSHQRRKPNIVLIITDQERSHKHWPPGWAETNLSTHYDCLIGCCRRCPSSCNVSECECDTRRSNTISNGRHCSKRTNRSSAVFTHAFTATTECSPSRASLLTSSYPSEHGVTTTPGILDPKTDRGVNHSRKKRNDNNKQFDATTTTNEDDCFVSTREDDISIRPNILRLLSSQQEYDVAWKGKWHLTPPFPTSRHANPNHHPNILNWYGATSPWNPPDAGHSLSVASTLGGGWKYNHDGRFLRGGKGRFQVLAQQQGHGNFAKEVKNGISDERDSSSDDDSDENGVKDEEDESIFDFLAKYSQSNNTGEKVGANNCERDNKPQVATATSTPMHSLQPPPSSTTPTQPFFLIASLVNPHDVWASACFSNLTDEEFFKETGYHPKDFESLSMELPPNHKDDLSTKPSIQAILRNNLVFGDLSDESYYTQNVQTQCHHEQQLTPHDNNTGSNNFSHLERQSDALRYFRFYAHLHKVVDAEIASLLDALESTGQMDNTIIIRMSDHGELALSHGMREKRMQCYEETIGIPLVINYPTGWFDGDLEDVGNEHNHDATKDPNMGVTMGASPCIVSSDFKDSSATNATDAGVRPSSTRMIPNLVSSIDILPTIAHMAGIEHSQYHYRGKSLVPALMSTDPATNKEEDILFTFDEPLAPPNIPGYIRCVRTPTVKYAVYFSLDGTFMEYEMYNLESDPYEMNNMCGPSIVPFELWHEYHARLTTLMYKMNALPLGFDWIEKSRPKLWFLKDEAICALQLAKSGMAHRR